MKAYQVRMDLKGSQPCIWRRVCVSADASFGDLHAVIQTVFGFQDRHSYMFGLPDHHLKVTNDEEAHEVYKEYLENREEMEKTLLALNTPFAHSQLEKLRTVVADPKEYRIEPYFQEGLALEYVYDFSKSWVVSLTVEKMVEDYSLHYPTLLAGEHGSPVEETGGLAGFEEFREAYYDPKHPDHKAAKIWGQQQGFGEYDREVIQTKLKSLMGTVRNERTK